MRQTFVDFAPEVGQLDFYFRQAGRSIAVIGRRLDDKSATFVDQELDQLRLRIDDPVFGHAVAGVEVQLFDKVAADRCRR